MVAHVSRFARLFAVAALVSIFLTATIAAAAPHRRPVGQGLGDPSADSTVPQIAPGQKAAKVRAWIEHAISIRLVALRGANAAATSRSALTANDWSLFGAQIATDRAGLVTLANGVRTDSTLTQLQGAITAMITEYRVFSVVVPQVQTTIHIDGYQATMDSLEHTEVEISAAVTTASALGDPHAVQQAYSALVHVVQSGVSALLSAHASVVSLTPSSFPQAAQTFQSAEATLATVRSDVQTAHGDIDEIVQLLRKRLGSTVFTGGT
ncbi:MAG: hypothetical protein WCF24_04670 [Acidimicrobiales bacterium]